MGKNIWAIDKDTLKGETTTETYFNVLYENNKIDFCFLVTYPLPIIPGINPNLTLAIPQRSAYLIHYSPGEWQPSLTTYKKLKIESTYFYSYDVSDTDSRPRGGSSGGMVFHANLLVGLHKGTEKIVSMVKIVKFLAEKNFYSCQWGFECFVSTFLFFLVKL